MDLKFPAPLRPGDVVGVTSPSSGASGPLQARLDEAVAAVRRAGLRVVVGACMDGARHISAPAAERAAELQGMLLDPMIRAVVPPWGGETAIDLVDLLDWPAIARAEPTWFVGFSDIATLIAPLTLTTGWATIHGQNLMDTPYRIPAGTRYLDTRPLAALGDGLIVYVEAAGDDAATICRNLHGLRLAGFFDGAAAVLVGRTYAEPSPTLTQHEAVIDALGRLDVPIVADVECGHWAPYLPLVNGALARVEHSPARSRITQTLA
ncbi:MAG: LD-carboxypeptidase [Austwickia sp.]|nr:LD-carboxypeptidase [Actinomycetota bacterium]MCB1254847.1 LD-carboxypeptidase [Austwickia sp.]